MTPEAATTLGGAFLFGLASSLHCVGMCGPLACLSCQGGGCPRFESALHYHLARLASYGLFGTLAGGVGWLVGPHFATLASSPWLWILVAAVAVLLLFAPNRMLARPRLLLRKVAPGWVGLATPLLPCGPLYFMFGICGLSGSAVRGATLALVFGMGTVPLLWTAQHQWGRLQKLVGVRGASLLQRGVLAAAALVLLWRLLPPGILPGPACCQPPPAS